MCGIAGLFSFRADSPRNFDRATLVAMTDAILHRGPDEEGLHFEPHVALGHRRLSIIDVATGQQPLFNEDGSVAIVYNGEIYNHLELVTELQACGHTFRTHCDTEVIVHGWEQWGERCVERFRGMFAFALWDRNRKTLFMARDRLGVKPLHYTLLPDGTLAFSSEIKSLKLLRGFDRTIDEAAVEEYFALGYIPDPRSIYRGTHKLPPAHTLTFKVGDSAPRVAQYWDVNFAPDQRIGIDEACDQLRQRLTEAIRIRMVAEVPLGAFLSGGVDSSAVVAMMARLSTDPVKTCSISFDQPEYDESAYARMVAEQYKTDHFVSQVRSDDFDVIDRLIGLYDEPYADSSALPTYRVCQLARQRVTVALSGDGGDETFGGYRRYRLHLMEEQMRSRLPLGLRQRLFGPLGDIFPKLDRLPRPFRAKTTLQALARDSVQAYFHSMCMLRTDERAQLYSDSFKRSLGGYNAFEVFRAHAAKAPTNEPLSLVQYLDYKTYLPGDINTKVDRASMAHSLEVREPLMDHLLVEWAATLPQALKLSAGNGKRVLKKAMESDLPKDILYRQKRGFAVPLASWFRGPLAPAVRQSLSAGRLVECGLFAPEALARLAAQHQSGERDRSAALWSLLIFDKFLEKA